MLQKLSKNVSKRVPRRAQNPSKMRLNFDVQNLMGGAVVLWWYGGGVGLPGVALQARTLDSPGRDSNTAGMWRCAGYNCPSGHTRHRAKMFRQWIVGCGLCVVG